MSYTVRLVLGAYSYTVTSGQPQSLDAGPVVLAGLRIGWRYAGDGWPAQLEPMTATVQLLVRDVAQLASLDVDQLASVRVTATSSAGTWTLGALYGRTAELAAEQVRRPRVDGTVELLTRYTVQLVDHLAGANVGINGPTSAVDTVQLRLQSVTAGGNDAGVQLTLPANPAWQLDATKTPTVDKPLVEYVGNVLTAMADPANGGRHYLLVPVANPADAAWPAPFDTWTRPGDLQALHSQLLDLPSSAELPTTLALTSAGVLELAPHTANGNGVPASRVQLGGSWRRDPTSAVRMVRVKRTTAGNTVTSKATGYSQGSARRLDVEVDAAGDSGAGIIGRGILAALAPDVTPAWRLDSFTYRPADPADLRDTFVPDLTTALYPMQPGQQPQSVDEVERAAPTWRRLVAVVGLRDQANLAGRTGVYAGQLTAAELSVDQDQQVSVTFSLRRRAPRPTSSAAADATWAWLRAGWPALRYRGATPRIDPDLTMADLRLVRK